MQLRSALGRLTWALFGALVATFLLASCILARAQDHHHSMTEMQGHTKFHSFYKEWKTQNGVSCCNDQDCHPLADRDLRVTPSGIQVFLPDYLGEKEWVTVPQERIRPYPAPDAQSHICHIGRDVICFVFGGAS